jgi:hypothetical protein
MSFRKLNYTEPSVLRGIITALIALAAALGFVATDEIKGAAEALIPVAAVVIPLAQSLWTRFAVWSPQSHAESLGKHAAGLSNGPA